MKRIAAIILAWVLTVSTAVCWAIPPAYGEADMAPPVQKSLFLKVSSITFSLVGESDDIYLGLVPRELVAWESEDAGIVSVEGGVLTAKGVGTTTIRATYNDRQVSCAASCLAQTQEELTKLANVRIQSKLDETESYAPDQYLIVQKAQVLTHGRYLALFISPDVDAMKAGFEAAFK